MSGISEGRSGTGEIITSATGGAPLMAQRGVRRPTHTVKRALLRSSSSRKLT